MRVSLWASVETGSVCRGTNGYFHLVTPNHTWSPLQHFRQWVVDNGADDTRDGIWRAFINRVRDHLHLVLAMSPVGEAFRARCRQFPSLINCCTIDWFTEWPAEALLSVSTRCAGAGCMFMNYTFIRQSAEPIEQLLGRKVGFLGSRKPSSTP